MTWTPPDPAPEVRAVLVDGEAILGLVVEDGEAAVRAFAGPTPDAPEIETGPGCGWGLRPYRPMADPRNDGSARPFGGCRRCAAAAIAFADASGRGEDTETWAQRGVRLLFPLAADDPHRAEHGPWIEARTDWADGLAQTDEEGRAAFMGLPPE